MLLHVGVAGSVGLLGWRGRCNEWCRRVEGARLATRAAGAQCCSWGGEREAGRWAGRALAWASTGARLPGRGGERAPAPGLAATTGQAAAVRRPSGWRRHPARSGRFARAKWAAATHAQPALIDQDQQSLQTKPGVDCATTVRFLNMWTHALIRTWKVRSAQVPWSGRKAITLCCTDGRPRITL